MNRGWKKTIDLSLRWNEEWTDENIHEMGKWTSEQIKKVIKDWNDYNKYGFELQELLEHFESICTKQEAAEINTDNYNFYLKELSEGKESFHLDIVPMEEYDECMRTLYDMADRERWWIERGQFKQGEK